jgi:protein phosphatase methylesterase 1
MSDTSTKDTASYQSIMSDLQRKWAKTKLKPVMISHGLNEVDEEGLSGDYMPDLPEIVDDDSSSASSASSTGTVIPSPSQRLFARPEGYVYSLVVPSNQPANG